MSDGPQAERLLNLKQAAALLDVHYMTVYRYVRQGRLDAQREGTQWRVSPASLERFRQPRGANACGGPALVTRSDPANGLRAPVEAQLAGADVAGVLWSDRLERCLLSGDEVAAWRVVEAALASGRAPEYCYVEMLGGALTSIGERWGAGLLDVADQHIATAVSGRLVARLGARFRRPGRSRGVVVFGAPTGELHSLPVAIAADLVRLAGFDVLELGANVPAEAFAAAAARTPRLVAVGIGITTAERVDAARAVVAAVRAANSEVPIILGGQAAWDPSATDLPGVSAWALDGRAVAATVTALVGARVASRQAPPDPIPSAGGSRRQPSQLRG